MTIFQLVTSWPDLGVHAVSASAARRLISAACHFERFQALISVAAYHWPLHGCLISAADQAWLGGCRGADGCNDGALARARPSVLQTMPATLPSFNAPSLAAVLAAEYLAAPAAVPTDRELAMLRGWIRAEFQRIPVMVRFEGADIDLPSMLQRWEQSGVLFISIDNISHPFLTNVENALFRAVHDWHHIVVDADSTLNGEIATFEHACSTAPSEIHWVLRSEIVLQAAACIATGEFQPQKLVR